MATAICPSLKTILPLLMVCAGWAHAQEGSNSMVPTITQPSGFGIDTIGAFLCGSPATVPHGSKTAVNALEAAFSDRKTRKARIHPSVAAPVLMGPALTRVRLCLRNDPFISPTLNHGSLPLHIGINQALKAESGGPMLTFSVPGISAKK